MDAAWLLSVPSTFVAAIVKFLRTGFYQKYVQNCQNQAVLSAVQEKLLSLCLILFIL